MKFVDWNCLCYTQCVDWNCLCYTQCPVKPIQGSGIFDLIRVNCAAYFQSDVSGHFSSLYGHEF